MHDLIQNLLRYSSQLHKVVGLHKSDIQSKSYAVRAEYELHLSLITCIGRVIDSNQQYELISIEYWK